ncbi:hypothetical protein M514_18155, partial [Trichuris suis]
MQSRTGASCIKEVRTKLAEEPLSSYNLTQESHDDANRNFSDSGEKCTAVTPSEGALFNRCSFGAATICGSAAI